MAYNDDRGGYGGGRNYRNDDRPQRVMYDVDMTCAECGAHIDKLPFQPSNDADGNPRPVYCFDCNKKRRADRPRRSGGFRRDRY